MLTLAGPIALIVIVAVWSFLLVLGWALVYHSQAENFVSTSELAVRHQKSFLDFLNLSLASMISGSFDLQPTASWVRSLMNLESFLGLALVTSSVSWILAISPALQGRSAAAQQILALYEAEKATRISLLDLPEDYVRQVLMDLAAQFNALRNETAQFPIIYYFGVASERRSLPRMLPYLRELALFASSPQCPLAVQFAGTILLNAVRGYIELIRTRFLRPSARTDEEILLAYLQDNNRIALPKGKERNWTESRTFDGK